MKIEWTEEYDVHILKFGNSDNMNIRIEWIWAIRNYYKVEVMGVPISRKFDSLNEAAVAGISEAKRMLLEALENLNNVGE